MTAKKDAGPALIPAPYQVERLEGSVPAQTPVSEVIDSTLGSAMGASDNTEAYEVRIASDRIRVTGGSQQALRYAAATLEQLRLQYPEEIPCMLIRDWPVHEWRSFHIDCARHFFPLEELKKMIGMAACFKFNRFHWHISDDQGWRIECNRYPKLHEISAWRNGDHFGAYASEEREGGYYTRQEVRELVAYCADLGIEVVPEIDMPGHVTAILAAYPELSCGGQPVEVADRAGIFRNILCAGKEETREFLVNLIDDLLELFPGGYFHIGGDEAPKEQWKTCPHCQQRMAREGLVTLQQLQCSLQNQVIAHLKEQGRHAIVWNEAVYGGMLDPDATVQLWTEDKDNRVREHLERGGSTILSPMMNAYCDYPYGFISLQSIYQLDDEPEALIAGAAPETPASAAVQENRTDRIRGTECLIWTEFIRDGGRLESQAWPRFAASAEVGWCGKRRPGYEDFTTRLQEIFPIFEKYGIHATEPEGWIPGQEEMARQFAEFKRNFDPEAIAEIRRAQEEV